jgi:hypothetical protein
MPPAGRQKVGHAPNSVEGKVLLENSRRARRVWWLLIGTATFCASFLYWAVDVLQGYGLAVGDGSALRPVGERRTMAALLAASGLLPFFGVLCYAGLYVTRMEISGLRLCFWTIGPFGLRAHPAEVDAVRSVTFHDWAIEPGSPISTPCLTLRLAGRRSPLLIDLGADYVNRDAIERLGRKRPATDPF